PAQTLEAQPRRPEGDARPAAQACGGVAAGGRARGIIREGARAWRMRGGGADHVRVQVQPGRVEAGDGAGWRLHHPGVCGLGGLADGIGETGRSYCLSVSLRMKLAAHAPGWSPRAVLAKLNLELPKQPRRASAAAG